MFEGIAEFFHEGGWTMYITATAGVIGWSIAIERGKKLFIDQKFNSSTFMSRVKELMLQDRLEDAIQYCNLESKNALPNVIKSGLERTGCDEKIVRQSMESSYLEASPKFTERIAYLGLIANAGLLFGLLGTVLGLIRQFTALASDTVADKQILMAKGISEAMNNTALGLMVALPCLIFHGIYSARSSHLLEELERGASQFLDWVGLYNYGQLNKRPSKNSQVEKLSA
jgi:biopolymer transport protein ExbB/TolQ